MANPMHAAGAATLLANEPTPPAFITVSDAIKQLYGAVVASVISRSAPAQEPRDLNAIEAVVLLVLGNVVLGFTIKVMLQRFCRGISKRSKVFITTFALAFNAFRCVFDMYRSGNATLTNDDVLMCMGRAFLMYQMVLLVIAIEALLGVLSGMNI